VAQSSAVAEWSDDEAYSLTHDDPFAVTVKREVTPDIPRPHPGEMRGAVPRECASMAVAHLKGASGCGHLAGAADLGIKLEAHFIPEKQEVAPRAFTFKKRPKVGESSSLRAFRDSIGGRDPSSFRRSRRRAMDPKVWIPRGTLALGTGRGDDSTGHRGRRLSLRRQAKACKSI
jgi:hypothetical protein